MATNGYIATARDKFAVRRVIAYRNSFRAWARGRIVPTASGTSIELEFTVDSKAEVFLVIWTVKSALFFAGGATAWAVSPVTDLLWLPILPLGLFALGWLLCTVSFRIELARILFEIRKLFEALR